MKLLLFLIILIPCITPARAQENRGTLIPAKIIGRSFMVGGSVSGAYSQISDKTSAETTKGHRQQFDMDAKVGYFILHDVAVGVRASAYHYKQSMDGQLRTSSTSLLAGPFARYYIDKGFFGEGSVATGINNRPNSSKTDVMEYRGGVGYALFINPKVAVEPGVFFSYYQEKRPEEGNRKVTELGPSVNIGLQVYLFRERKFSITPR